MRGIFHGLTDPTESGCSKNSVSIELLNFQMIDLSSANTAEQRLLERKLNTALLSSMKSEIKNYSDREFIYFIICRPKQKIKDAKKGRINKNKALFTINASGKYIKGSIDLSNYEHKKINVSHSERHLHIQNINVTESISSHNLLATLDIQTGIPSEIHYIGRTDNPARRVIDGNHRGLSDTILHALNHNQDVLLISCLFHMRFHSKNPSLKIETVKSNSMFDFLNMEKESDLIEQCLINYFLPDQQLNSRNNDQKKLNNHLLYLKKNHNIDQTFLHFEPDTISDYYHLGTSNQPPSPSHSFYFDFDQTGNIRLNKGMAPNLMPD